MTHANMTPAHATTDLNLWIELLPPDVQQRIAMYVCEGVTGVDSLHLAETTPAQRTAVVRALRHKLTGHFRDHEDRLVPRWVAVMASDVRHLELTEHPPNVALVASPALRHAKIDDEPTHLRAITRAPPSLRSVELVYRYGTPAYLVCRALAGLGLSELRLTCGGSACAASAFDGPELGRACSNVSVLHFTCHCRTGQAASLISGFPSLRDLTVDMPNVSGELTVIVSQLRALDAVRIKRAAENSARLLAFANKVGKSLRAIELISDTDDTVSDLAVLLHQVPNLERLKLRLPHSAELDLPNAFHSLRSLHLYWSPWHDMPDGQMEDTTRRPYYEPFSGTVLGIVQNASCLTSLTLGNVALSESEVVAIISAVGDRMEEFGISVDRQKDPMNERLFAVMTALRAHTRRLQKFELCVPYDAYGDRMHAYDVDAIPIPKIWDLLLCLDRLWRHAPQVYLGHIERIILDWTQVRESTDPDEIKKEDDRIFHMNMRRCLRGLNETGGVDDMLLLADLLERGCSEHPADRDTAIQIYRKAIKEHESTVALLKLWELTEGTQHGHTLELIKDVCKESSLRLYDFACTFEDGCDDIPPNPGAAVKLFQLALEDCPCPDAYVRLAKLVDEGYGDVSPNPQRAVDLLNESIGLDGDGKVAYRLACLVHRGYGDVSGNPAAAHALFVQGADKGYSPAMNDLGVLVERGYEGVEPDPEEAAKLYQRAINTDKNTVAMSNLGDLIEKGYEGHPPNPEGAIELYNKAIGQDDDPYAMRNLGYLLERGYDDVEPDLPRAVQLYRQAINQGDLWAFSYLADLVQKGYADQPPDPHEAIKLYTRAIEEGKRPHRADSYRRLGYLMERGEGDLAPDPKRGVELYNKAIEEGDALALSFLGDVIEKGYDEVPPDPVEAIRLYERAIEKTDDGDARRRLGYLIERGYGDVEPNPKRAVEMYKQAIEEGDVLAITYLADTIREGYADAPADPDEAARLYEQGIDKGDPEAMCELGDLLEHGWFGRYPDPLAAIKLYEEAIEKHGFGKAMQYLAITLEDGYLDVPANPKAAISMYKKAIKAKDVWSKVHLAVLLEEGYEGAKPDLEEARVLFEEAAVDPTSTRCRTVAMRRLGHVIEKMGGDDPEQVAKAAKWYQKAVERKEGPKSLFRLACVTLKGYGDTEPDVCKAVELLRQAVQEQDFAEAFFKLAEIVEKGYKGVEPRMDEAEQLYEDGTLLLWSSLPINDRQ